MLITGTAGGQGAAAQRILAEHGDRAIGCDIYPGGADAVAAKVRRDGLSVQASDVDLTDPDAAAAWVTEAIDRLGGIDVLYNNAGGFGFAPFSRMSLDLWRHVSRSELDFLFHAASVAWPDQCERGRATVNTSSISASGS